MNLLAQFFDLANEPIEALFHAGTGSVPCAAIAAVGPAAEIAPAITARALARDRPESGIRLATISPHRPERTAIAELAELRPALIGRAMSLTAEVVRAAALGETVTIATVSIATVPIAIAAILTMTISPMPVHAARMHAALIHAAVPHPALVVAALVAMLSKAAVTALLPAVAHLPAAILPAVLGEATMPHPALVVAALVAVLSKAAVTALLPAVAHLPAAVLPAAILPATHLIAAVLAVLSKTAMPEAMLIAAVLIAAALSEAMRSEALRGGAVHAAGVALSGPAVAAHPVRSEATMPGVLPVAAALGVRRHSMPREATRAETSPWLSKAVRSEDMRSERLHAESTHSKAVSHSGAAAGAGIMMGHAVLTAVLSRAPSQMTILTRSAMSRAAAQVAEVSANMFIAATVRSRLMIAEAAVACAAGAAPAPMPMSCEGIRTMTALRAGRISARHKRPHPIGKSAPCGVHSLPELRAVATARCGTATLTVVTLRVAVSLGQHATDPFAEGLKFLAKLLYFGRRTVACFVVMRRIEFGGMGAHFFQFRAELPLGCAWRRVIDFFIAWRACISIRARSQSTRS
ncbi:MAG TPA: hypothetical protein VFE24_02705 [Pirellulales bacterium]|nr:hypothetical protein [Pirellulales bacterium]